MPTEPLVTRLWLNNVPWQLQQNLACASVVDAYVAVMLAICCCPYMLFLALYF